MYIMSGFIEEIGNNDIDIGEPIMHGGAKLSPTWRLENKIDDNITPFFWKDKAFLRGVLHMLEIADTIECISYKSLYAFVFVISVPKKIKESRKNELPFSSITIGESNAVTKLILKMSLLANDDTKKKEAQLFLKNTTNQLYNNIEKGVDTVASFKEEVKTQIEIFLTTWMKGGLANCPSIVFDEAFDKKDSLLFLNYILNVDYKLTKTSKRMLIYLKDVITREPVLQLGLIAMEYAEKFTIFHAYYHNLKVTQKNIDEAISTQNINKFLDSDYSKLLHKIALIFANMLVLYFNTYVHCDLHTNNVFIIGDDVTSDIYNNQTTCNIKEKLLSDSKYSCIRIIDFGRVTRKISYTSNHPQISMNYFQSLNFNNKNKNDTIVKDIMTDDDSSKYKDNGKRIPQYEPIVKDIMTDDDSSKYKDNGKRIPQYEPITGLFKTILDIFQDIYNTDLQYNRTINSTIQIPQCFVYFQLLKLVKPIYVKPITNPPRIEKLESDFFIFDKNFMIKDIKSALQYSNDQKYVMALIIQYFITYTDPIKIKDNISYKDTIKLMYTPLNIINRTPEGRPVQCSRATLPINQLNQKGIEDARPDSNVYRCKGTPEENIPNTTVIDPYETFKQSFQGQLLRYRLEQLKIQLDLKDETQKIEPITIESFQLDDEKRFDLFDNENGSIRTKEPGLELFFQSIDDIIGMKN